MKLISMTEFVLDKQRFKEDSDTAIFKITNYANFLKQPLKLEMFVPCDEESNFFEEPRQVSPDGIKWEEYLKKYQQAKEKVLFEGFEIKDNVFLLNDKIFFASAINAKQFFIHYQTIEDLSNHFLSNEIILTPNAIKQLGL